MMIFNDIYRMEVITVEKAAYIIAYYSHLLTDDEQKALKHLWSMFKLEGDVDGIRTRMYVKTGRLSTDLKILELTENGYDAFAMACATRIIREAPDKVFFNLCPVCKRLARTPKAKQCRWCGYDWH